eukprot:7832358-Pyramimonas_sp.AAC.2
MEAQKRFSDRVWKLIRYVNLPGDPWGQSHGSSTAGDDVETCPQCWGPGASQNVVGHIWTVRHDFSLLPDT